MIEEKEIKESLEEAKRIFETEGEFEGEIYLSTDGKHTVHIKANTKDGRKAGGEWALKVYEGIANRLGTKPKMWGDVMKKKESTEPYTGPHCPKCKGEMVLRDGKYGKFYGCVNYPDCNGMTKLASGKKLI